MQGAHGCLHEAADDEAAAVEITCKPGQDAHSSCCWCSEHVSCAVLYGGVPQQEPAEAENHSYQGPWDQQGEGQQGEEYSHPEPPAGHDSWSEEQHYHQQPAHGAYGQQDEWAPEHERHAHGNVPEDRPFWSGHGAHGEEPESPRARLPPGCTW